LIPDEFLRNYSIIRKTDYDLRNIPRLLPVYTDDRNAFTQALKYIESNAPTLISNGKILFDSNTLYKRILGKLQEYNYMYSPLPIRGEEWKVPTNIRNYYTDVNDFPKYENTLIFLNEKNYRAWLNSINRTNGALQVTKKLTDNIILLTIPLIYQDIDGKIYLVQNFIGGESSSVELRQAINNASVWQEYKVNLGLTTTPLVEGQALPPYVLYTKTSAGNIIPIEDHSNGTIPYLQILVLQPSAQIKRYISLLPLL
jgi:hypothetical protein